MITGLEDDDCAKEFLGLPIVDYVPGAAPASWSGVAPRLRIEYGERHDILEILERFLAETDTASVAALVIGLWTPVYEGEAQPVLDRLVSGRERLPALRGLFVGDVPLDDCDFMYLNPGTYGDVLDAFPGLEALRVRGSCFDVFEATEHLALRELVVECRMLHDEQLQAIAASRLPALQRLELWLDECLGGREPGRIDDLDPLFDALGPRRFGHLGLCNSVVADELAAYVASRPWLARIDTLDLSFGTLGDAGARALAESPHINGLKRLDIRHHYIGADGLARLRALPIEVIADVPREPVDGDRLPVWIPEG